MWGKREPSDLINHQFSTAVFGLVLAVGGALLSEPLMIITEENSDSISILVAIYSFLFLFLPLTFFLNIVLLLTHVGARVDAPIVPLRFFFLRYLCRAARAVSVVTLLLGFPLSVHVALTEDSEGWATGLGLACFALLAILIFSFCHTSRGFGTALFALSISTGLLLFVDPLLSFSNQNCHDPLIDIPTHVLAFFLIPLTFMLGMAVLILRIAAPANEQQAATHAEHLVTVGTLSAACVTLLVSMYTLAHVAVADMAAIGC